MIQRIRIASLALLILPVLAEAAAPVEQILGRWKGTSICTKIPDNEACKDEVVVYEFTRVPKNADAVHIKADKIVNGEQQNMGEFDMNYSPANKRWEYEFKTRVHAMWTFSASGKELTGTLYRLPEMAVGRNAKAQKME